MRVNHTSMEGILALQADGAPGGSLIRSYLPLSLIVDLRYLSRSLATSDPSTSFPLVCSNLGMPNSSTASSDCNHIMGEDLVSRVSSKTLFQTTSPRD